MADDFNKNVERIKEAFYAKQKKNLFFTSSQKLELANNVSASMNTEDLFHRTVYVIEGTNRVYVNYCVFKLFANPANYEELVKYMLVLLQKCCDVYDSFEIHVNLDTFTISACHRYREVIEMYLNECMKHDTFFAEKLIKMHLYNIPAVFDNIQKMLAPLIHEEVKRKIDLHNKKESPPLLSALLS
jgi:hypothetical protein